MRLGKYLSSLTKPEVDELREQLNLTDEELPIFDELSKGRSKLCIAENCRVCVSTVDSKTKSIKEKLFRLKGGADLK